MTSLEQLSDLERARVNTEAAETLTRIFHIIHETTGWCGDSEPEPWVRSQAVLAETLARLTLRTR